MTTVWRISRIVIAASVVTAMTVVAVPEPRPAPEPMSPLQPMVREPLLRVAQARGAAPGEPQLDMARLRRLLPADPAPPAEAVAVVDAMITSEGGEATLPAESEAVVSEPNLEARVDTIDAFASKSWYVPPPPPPPPPVMKPLPPPKPTAPPLPFTFLGRFDNPGDPALVMLVRGDLLYTVSEGDTIDGTYRVDRINVGSVELTYLPLKQKQVLRTDGPA